MENESVKCVVAVNAIIVYNGKLLLIKHNRPEKAKGKWWLPWGKVDKGENFNEALHREIMEEVGIEIRNTEIKKLAILHDFPETTCKHLYEIKLSENFDRFKFDSEEIQLIDWHDLQLLNLKVEDYRNDWVYYVLQDYVKWVFNKNNFIYSIVE